jgi:hypothetical protein
MAAAVREGGRGRVFDTPKKQKRLDQPEAFFISTSHVQASEDADQVIHRTLSDTASGSRRLARRR